MGRYNSELIPSRHQTSIEVHSCSNSKQTAMKRLSQQLPRLRSFQGGSQRSKQWASSNRALAGAKLTETFSSRKRRTNHHNNDWIYHLQVSNTSQATENLEEFRVHLSRTVTTTKKNKMIPPKMIVVEHTSLTTVETALEYLREVLPVGAQLVEQHPEIGGRASYGRRNAHGKPLDHHVAGICYAFPPSQFQLAELAHILDVYLPTRLALDVNRSILNQTPDPNTPEWKTHQDQLEAVVENTDVLMIGHTTSSHHHLWSMVWEAQQRDGCQETYAILSKNKLNDRGRMIQRIHQAHHKHKRRF